MATYLVVKLPGGTTHSVTAKAAQPTEKPYLQVKNGYFPLTTATTTGSCLKVKVNGSQYRVVETYTTTISVSTSVSTNTSSTNTYSYNTFSTNTYSYNTSSTNTYSYNTSSTNTYSYNTSSTNTYSYNTFSNSTYNITQTQRTTVNDTMKISSIQVSTNESNSLTHTLTFSQGIYVANKSSTKANTRYYHTATFRDALTMKGLTDNDISKTVNISQTLSYSNKSSFSSITHRFSTRSKTSANLTPAITSSGSLQQSYIRMKQYSVEVIAQYYTKGSTLSYYRYNQTNTLSEYRYSSFLLDYTMSNTRETTLGTQTSIGLAYFMPLTGTEGLHIEGISAWVTQSQSQVNYTAQSTSTSNYTTNNKTSTSNYTTNNKTSTSNYTMNNKTSTSNYTTNNKTSTSNYTTSRSSTTQSIVTSQ